MQRPPRPCTVCGKPVVRSGRCELHYKQAEARRGSSTARGYGARHRGWFRAEVLKRDPICVECGENASTHADHYPMTRRQLIRAGLDPDDPQHGRGLCQSCHNAHTAADPNAGA